MLIAFNNSCHIFSFLDYGEFFYKFFTFLDFQKSWMTICICGLEDLFNSNDCLLHQLFIIVIISIDHTTIIH